MKNLLTAFLALLLSGTAAIAQPYFLGDVKQSGDTLIFSIKPVGTITDQYTDIEFYIRWAVSEGNSFSFSNIKPNLTAFPGLSITHWNNDAADPGYNNEHFAHLGVATAMRTYTNGTLYEVFRTNISGGIPSVIEMVSDNQNVDPYYFTVLGAPADYTAYPPLSPFVNPTGNIGPFFYQTLALGVLPITLNSFTAKAPDCNALLEWVTGSEVNSDHFEIQQSSDGVYYSTVANVLATVNSTTEHTYKKSLPLTNHLNYYRLKMISKDNKITYSQVILLKDDNCSPQEPLLTVLVMPNPVIDHKLQLQVKIATEDDIDINVLDMSGKQMGKYGKHVSAGTNNVLISLPGFASGQYLLKITSMNNGNESQKIMIQ
jgi:hypothetical protein